MRKLLIFASLLALTKPTNAQQWGGSTNSSNGVFRSSPVAIGQTTSGAADLEITTHMANGGIVIETNGSTGTGGSMLTLVNSIYANRYALGALSNGHLNIFNTDYSGTSTVTRNILDVDPATGNIGIGTTSPGAKLDVTDGSLASLRVLSNSYNDAKITVANYWLGYTFSVDNSAVGHISGPSGNLLSYIARNGVSPQVWVGTQKPLAPHDDFSFAVAGKAVCQSLYITTPVNWADYVFAKDYKLPKLADVEAFYKENKHLPEIPTAQEIAEKGIDVSEMNTLLVKKIEELTIYLVELQKEIEALKKSNK